jgi:cytochrome c oxidase assembly factor CtaG
MWRERTLKIVLVLVGVLFLAGIYPTVVTLWHHDRSGDTDAMMLSLYFALGVFLLIAVRSPSEHRSLIAFAAWSSFAHGVVMGVLAYQIPAERMGLSLATGVLFVIGVTLIALAPGRPPISEQAGALTSGMRTGVLAGRS